MARITHKLHSVIFGAILASIMQRSSDAGCYFYQHPFRLSVMKYSFLLIGVLSAVVSRPAAVHNTQLPQNLEFVD
ncbi:hypothetical protein AOX56_04140 [Aeromonas sobria]|uniref:Uncharacterized protein n=1 Tax=Aeromonas sobria TaxID=646 RepID=A0A2N3IUI8_AERSO|nr:hypothetical protein AOX56_04140 [Aeromonas sobria]